MQRPHKQKEYRSDCNKNRVETVKFDSYMQEVNIMVYHDEPIPGNQKVKIRP